MSGAHKAAGHWGGLMPFNLWAALISLGDVGDRQGCDQ